MEMETSRRRKRTKLIDTEWEESLKGLSKKVPNNWWTGCNGQILLNLFNQSTQKWNLILGSNPIHHGLSIAAAEFDNFRSTSDNKTSRDRQILSNATSEHFVWFLRVEMDSFTLNTTAA